MNSNLPYFISSSKNDGDMREKQNLNLFLQKNNLENLNLKQMKQIHSNIVKICSDNINEYECDGLISDNASHLLMVYTADCIPMVFYDKKNKIAAIAHAGRNGVFQNISKSMIETLIEKFNCKCEDIFVNIGPSICKECYEVSLELANIAVVNFGKEIEENRKIDLIKITLNQLEELNIPKNNISYSNKCTKCNPQEYFSYRFDKTKKRFATFTKIV